MDEHCDDRERSVGRPAIVNGYLVMLTPGHWMNQLMNRERDCKGTTELTHTDSPGTLKTWSSRTI